MLTFSKCDVSNVHLHYCCTFYKLLMASERTDQRYRKVTVSGNFNLFFFFYFYSLVSSHFSKGLLI